MATEIERGGKRRTNIGELQEGRWDRETEWEMRNTLGWKKLRRNEGVGKTEKELVEGGG